MKYKTQTSNKSKLTFPKQTSKLKNYDPKTMMNSRKQSIADSKTPKLQYFSSLSKTFIDP